MRLMAGRLVRIATVALMVGCAGNPPPASRPAPAVARSASAPARAERTTKHCTELVFRSDMPTCLGEVSEATARRMYQSWTLRFEGTRVVRSELVSPSGRPVEEDGYSASEYEYDGNGRVRVVRRFDRFGELFGTDRISEDGRRRAFLDPWGRPRVERGTEVSVIERDFDASGLITRLRCFDAHGRPTPNDGGVHEMRWKRDARGLVVAEAGFDERGQPTEYYEGYHEMRRELDSRGRALAWKYFGLDGKPVVTRNGFHASRHAFDPAGNLIRTEWLGASGEPTRHVMGNYGFDITRDSAGRIQEFAYFDLGGRPVAPKGGYASVRSAYDKRDLVVDERYFDPRALPVLNRDGYAGLLLAYDEKGRKTEERYLGVDGAPMLVLGKFGIVRLEYDARNRLIAKHYLGVDGKPVLVPAGFSIWRTTYDEFGQQIETGYYGAGGEPVDSGFGYFRQRISYDGSGKVSGRAFESAAGKGVEVIRFREIIVRYAGAPGATPDVKRTAAEARTLAQGVRKRLAEGLAFRAAVLRYSDDARGRNRSFDGDAGFTAAAELRAELRDVLSKLEENELSEVINDNRGYSIVQRLSCCEARGGG